MPSRNNRKRSSSTKVSKNVKRYVKRTLNRNIEMKYKNTLSTVSFASISNSWTELNLTDISQGDSVIHRSGRELMIKAFHLNGILVGGQSNLATDDNRNIVRVVLGLWDNSTPLTTAGADINSYIAPKQAQGAGLVKKYIDMIIPLVSQGQDSTGYMPAMRKINKFLKMSRKIQYSADTSTSSNTFLVLSMISDSSAVSNPGFVQGSIKIFFQDA